MKVSISLAAALSLAAVVALVLGASGVPTLAANDPPLTPLVSSTPQTTTASYGDWTLRCTSAGNNRQCEATVSLAVVQHGRQIPIAQIAFGHASGPKAPLLVTVLLPVNVSFDKPAQFGPDEAHLTPLVYRRCMPAGCLANATPDAAMLALSRTAKKVGRLVFTDASERLAVLPVSLRGLAQALDALANEK